MPNIFEAYIKIYLVLKYINMRDKYKTDYIKLIYIHIINTNNRLVDNLI